MPTQRLDAFNVRSLPAVGGRRTDYRDDPSAPGGVRGLVLRVSPTGARSFSIVYSGDSKRYTLGRTPPLKLSEAREEARRLLARIELGEDPQAARRRAKAAELTVAGLVADCVAGLRLAATTRKEWKRLAKVELGHETAIGRRPAVALTRDEIRKLGASIARRSAYTANRTFELLRRAYSWGVEQDLLPGTPFVHLPLPAQEHESERVLSTDELRALLLALEPLEGQYADATRLLLLTGVRREMVVGARASELQELDGADPRWIVPGERTKNGRPHVVPLSPTAAAIFRRLAARTDDRLFPPGRAAEVRPETMWWSSRFVHELRSKVDKHASRRLERWTIHGLRHTVATHLAEDLAVSETVIARILGHTPAGPRVTRVYLRAELLPERRAALERWAAWLEALQRGTDQRQRRADVVPLAR